MSYDRVVSQVEFEVKQIDKLFESYRKLLTDNKDRLR